MVFEVSSGEIVGRETRNHAPHHSATCDSNQTQHHAPAHNCTVAGLEDCEVVLCGGMGMKAAEWLLQSGIRPFIVDARHTPEEVVAAFLAGNLPSVEKDFCRCHEQ